MRLPSSDQTFTWLIWSVSLILEPICLCLASIVCKQKHVVFTVNLLGGTSSTTGSCASSSSGGGAASSGRRTAASGSGRSQKGGGPPPAHSQPPPSALLPPPPLSGARAMADVPNNGLPLGKFFF